MGEYRCQGWTPGYHSSLYDDTIFFNRHVIGPTFDSSRPESFEFAPESRHHGSFGPQQFSSQWCARRNITGDTNATQAWPTSDTAERQNLASFERLDGLSSARPCSQRNRHSYSSTSASVLWEAWDDFDQFNLIDATLMQQDEDTLFGAHTHYVEEPYQERGCAGELLCRNFLAGPECQGSFTGLIQDCHQPAWYSVQRAGIHPQNSFGCSSGLDCQEMLNGMVQDCEKQAWDSFPRTFQPYTPSASGGASGRGSFQASGELDHSAGSVHRMSLHPTSNASLGQTQPSCEFQREQSSLLPPSAMSANIIINPFYPFVNVHSHLGDPHPPSCQIENVKLSPSWQMQNVNLCPPLATSEFDTHVSKARADDALPPLSSRQSSGLSESSLRENVMQVKPRIRRRKVGNGDKHSLGGRPAVIVSEGDLTPIAFTPEMLRKCFGMPLYEAARTLGICATAVKKCCRKMGIKEWPFQRIKPIRTRLARLRIASPRTRDVEVEIQQLLAEEATLLQGQGLSCF